MKKLNRSGIIMILIVIAGWLVLRFVTEPTYLIGILQGEYVNKTGELEAGKVIRVVDGDTLVIEVNGKHEKVRLIGIDTPESAGVFEENPELYGMEAS